MDDADDYVDDGDALPVCARPVPNGERMCRAKTGSHLQTTAQQNELDRTALAWDSELIMQRI